MRDTEEDTETDTGVYYIDLDMTIEYIGDELPSEDAIIAPIKSFINKTIKTYKKKAKLVNLKTNIYEAGFEDEADPGF